MFYYFLRSSQTSTQYCCLFVTRHILRFKLERANGRLFDRRSGRGFFKTRVVEKTVRAHAPPSVRLNQHRNERRIYHTVRPKTSGKTARVDLLLFSATEIQFTKRTRIYIYIYTIYVITAILPPPPPVNE